MLTPTSRPGPPAGVVDRGGGLVFQLLLSTQMVILWEDALWDLPQLQKLKKLKSPKQSEDKTLEVVPLKQLLKRIWI